MIHWLKEFVDSRKLPAKPVHAVYGSIDGPGTFLCEVVGESKYQHNLIAICGQYQLLGSEQFETAVLVPEFDNPYDPNAVRIEVRELAVGYLNRESAAVYVSELRRRGMGASRLSVKAVIRGGWDDGQGDVGMYGVRLDFPMTNRAKQ